MVKRPKSSEVRYRKQLQRLTRRIREDVNTKIIPILKQFEPEYVNDAIVVCDVYAEVLEKAFDELRKSYNDIDKEARFVANSFVEGTNNTNKRRFYAAMEGAIGVNLQSIVQNEGLEDTLRATTRSNVGLIVSIPQEHFKNIETIVFTGTTQGRNSRSMIAQIMDLNGNMEKRARVIARDQTSKLNSALNQQRQQNLGVEEYIWRTAEDGDRVRPTHRSKNGKVFRWDSPPPDTGHPGEDIQCRCIAQPLIKI